MRPLGGRRLDLAVALGLPIALALCVVAQVMEGGSALSLLQPTAAFVVFGGTLAAVLVSFPSDVVRRALTAAWSSLFIRSEALDPMLDRILYYAHQARRKGVISLEDEIDRASDPFLRAALILAVDGTSPNMARQILETESHAQAEAADVPAQVLETAAGYTPTLGILGAVLGLIHVMESLTDPSRLGPGIAVAFVATVYGVGAANLVLLPLATRLRGRTREAALARELVIEGMVAVQEGTNPRLIEQKLRGYIAPQRRTTVRHVA